MHHTELEPTILRVQRACEELGRSMERLLMLTTCERPSQQAGLLAVERCLDRVILECQRARYVLRPDPAPVPVVAAGGEVVGVVGRRVA